MKDKIKKVRDSFKHINWRFIWNGAIIFGMLALLIGYIFLTLEIIKVKQDIEELKIIHEIKDMLFDEYDVDSKIKID